MPSTESRDLAAVLLVAAPAVEIGGSALLDVGLTGLSTEAGRVVRAAC
ncbi:hypothetical protein ACI780_07005 [Geodermatophilus sp. SYSU D00814]